MARERTTLRPARRSPPRRRPPRGVAARAAGRARGHDLHGSRRNSSDRPTWGSAAGSACGSTGAPTGRWCERWSSRRIGTWPAKGAPEPSPAWPVVVLWQTMRSPVRSLPPDVERWVWRARWLGWLEALAVAVVVWPLLALWLADLPPLASAILALGLVGLAALVPALRRRWRPIRALVSLSASRGLRPGDHAWLLLPDYIEPVIVTARRASAAGRRPFRPGPDRGTRSPSYARPRRPGRAVAQHLPPLVRGRVPSPDRRGVSRDPS